MESAVGLDRFKSQFRLFASKVVYSLGTFCTAARIPAGHRKPASLQCLKALGGLPVFIFTIFASALIFDSTARASSATATVGQSVALSVSVSGTSPFSYQWYKNNVAVVKATLSTYTISPVASGDAGNYSVVVSNSSGSTTSDVASLGVSSVQNPPTISTQPASLSVVVGQATSLSVSAAGSGTLSYQWSKNGTAISGANSATLSFTSAATINSGSYSVKVSNSVGSVTSSAASLNVTPSGKVPPPTITSQPVSVTVFAGQTATFRVVATAPSSLVYQWRCNGANIAGARSPTCSIANVSSANVGSYTVVVAYGGVGVTSQPATLSLAATGAKPVITSQPKAETVASGGAASFSVVATGPGPFHYQWKKNGYDTGAPSLSAFSISRVKSTDAGTYQVVVANGAGFISSTAVTLTVSGSVTNAVVQAAVALSQPLVGSLSTALSNSLNGSTATVVDGLELVAVGTLQVTSKASQASDTISLTGGGSVTTQGRIDSAAYLAQISSTDCAIVTHILPHTSTAAVAGQAGLMMRDSLDDESIQATLAIDSTGKIVFAHRATNGAQLVTETFTNTARHLLLDKHLGTITAMISADGTTWQTLSTTTIAFADDVYIGLVSMSTSAGVGAETDFDGFDVLEH